MEIYFRGQLVPPTVVKPKSKRVEWALRTAKDSGKPEISTKEFVYDLQVHRFGGYIFNLRDKGWEIITHQKEGPNGEKYHTFELIHEAGYEPVIRTITTKEFLQGGLFE